MNNKPIEQQLALRYAQICDDRDFESMRSIISEDFKQQGPQWHCENADAFMQQLKVLENNFSATLHMVANQLGEWQGTTYNGETYTVASHIYQKNAVERKLEMAIRYSETIAKIDGQYRYTRRDVNIVWTSDQPLFIE